MNHVPFVPSPDMSRGDQNLMLLAACLEGADARHEARGEPTYNQEAYHHDCGTPACAAGHWAVAWPSRWRLVCNGVRLVDGPLSYIKSTDAIRRDFSLTEEQRLELFGGVGCGGARSSAEAAAYIREFALRRSGKL